MGVNKNRALLRRSEGRIGTLPVRLPGNRSRVCVWCIAKSAYCTMGETVFKILKKKKKHLSTVDTTKQTDFRSTRRKWPEQNSGLVLKTDAGQQVVSLKYDYHFTSCQLPTSLPLLRDRTASLTRVVTLHTNTTCAESREQSRQQEGRC